MSDVRFFGGRFFAATGVLGLAALGAVMWSGASAPETAAAQVATEEVVRLHGGTSYVPHDVEAFDELATGLSDLPDEELAQMAGFADALAADLDEYSPDELAGRIGDLLTVVDLAYADARRIRPAAPGYDVDALRGITDRIGYDTDGLTGG